VTSRVRDEITITARTLKTLTPEIEQRCRGLLEVLGLAHLTTVSPYHLSGGEQRRLALACALAHGPDAVLLDEPTVGQDRSTWAVVVGVCAAAAEAGTAICVAGHDRRLVDAIADDRIALMPR
jgi:energy-coupling factor transport system ATP-binding protein